MSSNRHTINGLDSNLNDEQTVNLEPMAEPGSIEPEMRSQPDRNSDSPDLKRQLDAASAMISLLESNLENTNEQIKLYEREIRELRKGLLVAEGVKQADSLASNGQDAPVAIRRIRLLIADNGDATTEYEIKSGRTCLGSSLDNDIQLRNEFVSRHHAQIVSNADACILGDLNSTNGTFVNSNRVKRHALQEGDFLTIGKLRFRYITRQAGDRMPTASSAKHGYRE